MKWADFQAVIRWVEKAHYTLQLAFRIAALLEEHCFCVIIRKFKQSLALWHLQEKIIYFLY